MEIRKEDPNRSKTLFSVSSLADKLTLSIIRFPITIVLVFGLAGLFFIQINNGYDSISYRLWLFFSVGIFIATSATLFIEDFLDNLKSHGFTLIPVLLWGTYCFLLPEKANDLEASKGIEVSVVSGAAFLALFFIPFFPKNADRAFWNFTTQILFHLTLAGFFGTILFGGLSLALLAIDSLFNISIDGDVYANLAVVCYAIIAPFYFLAHIPDKEVKRRDEIFYTRVQKIFALYIIAPILLVYAVILYAYLFKIIIAWELPTGWVSWLVSALALGGLLLITFLYPIRETSKNKVVEFLSRWLGIVIFPLLVLMTIGIFHRIGEYGLTINRAYILLLNFWFYGIYLYLFTTRSRHIKWILISPVIVALLTSISYWGVADITKKSLTAEVRTVLGEQLTAEEARTILTEMSQIEREKIKGKLEYLHQYFGKESVQPFFEEDVSTSHWRFLSELGLRDDFSEKMKRISFSTSPGKIWKVNDYNSFVRFHYSPYGKKENINYSLNNGLIELEVDNHIFTFPVRKIVDEFLATEEDLRSEQEYNYQGDNFLVLISSFHGQYYPEKDSIFLNSLNGFLLFD